MYADGCYDAPCVTCVCVTCVTCHNEIIWKDYCCVSTFM